MQALYTLESLGGDGYDTQQSRSYTLQSWWVLMISDNTLVAEDRHETYAGNATVGHSAGYTGGSNINFGGNVYVGNNESGYFHDGGASVFIGNTDAGQNYMTGSVDNVFMGASAMRGFANPLNQMIMLL